MVDTPQKTRPRLFLIDGYALIYRAFFAMLSRPLTTTRGENTSAAFGFARFLLDTLKEYEPDYLGVVLDAGTSARTERYAAYKATREKMPDDLQASMPRIRQLLDAFRVPVLELQDHEADDVIGTLAMRAIEQDKEAAALQGVNVNVVNALAFGVGFALAAASGALMAPIFKLDPMMGEQPLLKAFIIIILGGLGSIPGAILGGLILGQIDSIVATVLGLEPAFLLSFVFIILLLLFKPTGLFGHEV